MKTAEVPKGVVIGVLAVIAVVLVLVGYLTMFKSPPEVDAAKTLSPERLLDPSPQRPDGGGAARGSGD